MSPPPGAAPPTCRSAEDLARLDDQVVVVEGLYRRHLQQASMPRPGRPPPELLFLGTVVLELSSSPGPHASSARVGEGARVRLGQGPRRDEEVARFEGLRVRVRGRLVLDPTRLLTDEERELARPDPLPLLLQPGEVVRAD